MVVGLDELALAHHWTGVSVHEAGQQLPCHACEGVAGREGGYPQTGTRPSPQSYTARHSALEKPLGRLSQKGREAHSCVKCVVASHIASCGLRLMVQCQRATTRLVWSQVDGAVPGVACGCARMRAMHRTLKRHMSTWHTVYMYSVVSLIATTCEQGAGTQGMTQGCHLTNGK